MMDFDKLFVDFSRAIEECNHILTEDSMRYYFFACMLLQDSDLNHYILELPYQKMSTVGIIADIIDTGIQKQQELDLFYDGDVQCCFEFKFHRTGESESTFAEPHAAGSIFNDLNRLQLIKSSNYKVIKKFFIYLTDSKMHEYLANPQNSFSKQLFRIDLKKFFLLKPNQRFSKIRIRVGKKNATFKSAAYKSFIDRDMNKNVVTIDRIRMCSSSDFEVNKSCTSFSNFKAYIRIFEIM